MAVVEINSGAPGASDEQRLAYAGKLEAGDILFFPQIPFAFPEAAQKYLLSVRQTQSGHHKNIAYKPRKDSVSNFSKDSADQERLRVALRDFSGLATGFLRDFFPMYAPKWRLDYASFRPIEEQGRNLSQRSRNDLLHTDAFPTRPTNGDLILRFFVNINPDESRVWNTSIPFEPLVQKYGRAAGLDAVVRQARSPLRRPLRMAARAGQMFGLKTPDRSPYDQFMLRFHNYLKGNSDFQQNGPKLRSEFPPGCAWMVFTDVVPHAVVSGQFALEQTYMINHESLTHPDRAPLRALERLAGVAMI